MTLADEDSNSIPIDDGNRAILGNVAMQVAPCGAAYISFNFGHQVDKIETNVSSTTWRHLHCHIAWDWPLTSSVGIELLSSSARVTSAKSAKRL